MNYTRLIYDDTPEFIPVPKELVHRKIEVIFLLLDEETNAPLIDRQTSSAPTLTRDEIYADRLR